MPLRPLFTSALRTSASRFICAALVLAPMTGAALAHDGHGMEGSHWHATDLVGLIIGLGVAALTWRSRGNK